MKSIAKHFRIQLFISIILSFALFTLFFLLDFQLRSYARCIQETGVLFSNLNRLFTNRPIEQETITLVQKYFPASPLPMLVQTGDISKTQEEARRLAREIQDLRNQRLERLIVQFRLIMGIIFPLFSLLIFFIIVLGISLRHLFRQAKDIAHHYATTFFLNFIPAEREDTTRSFTSLIPLVDYKELETFTSLFSQNQEALRFVRDFLSMDHSFSLEAFIDQFGAIVCGETYQNLLPCDRFSLAVYDSREDLLIAYHAYTRYNTPVLLQKGFSQRLSDTSLKKIIDNGLPFRIIHDLTEHASPSAELLILEGIHSNLTIPILINQRIFGFLFFAHRKTFAYTADEGRLALLISNLVKTRFFYSYAIQKTLSVFGDGIVNLVEFKDDETADHTRRVSLYSEVIASVLSEQGLITPQKAREITNYAPLHDIGKIGIPDHILQKPGKLTEEEWQIMRQHPWIGGKLIRVANQQLIDELGYGLLHTAYNLIVDHHEWWDGSGYPQRKKEKEISIEGQIVAIADVFDALSTKRPYKEAFPFEISVQMLCEQKGSHFNPDLVDIFIEKKAEVYKIYRQHYINRLDPEI
ncbi:MAG: HD domain-containing protein [Treponemataceae bacterium]|nr:HD domain-containing protein [Treponemataceae bacterium]